MTPEIPPLPAGTLFALEDWGGVTVLFPDGRAAVWNKSNGVFIDAPVPDFTSPGVTEISEKEFRDLMDKLVPVL